MDFSPWYHPIRRSIMDNQEEGFLRPQDIAPRQGVFPETMLVCFSNRMITLLGKRYPVKAIGSHFAGVPLPIYSFSFKQQEMGIYLTCPGAPASAVFLEETISRGAKRFLFFGSCGSLDGKATEGKLIIPEKAFRDEGTSAHYGAQGDWVTVRSAGTLASLFKQMEVPFISCPVWTTDAPYRETPSKIARLRALGCLAVEMECAGIMAVSDFRNVDAYQFLYTSDRLDGPQWEKGETKEAQVLSVALEAAAMLNSCATECNKRVF